MGLRMSSSETFAVRAGEGHKRQRKVMLPAFGTRESKALLPVFRHYAERVCLDLNVEAFAFMFDLPMAGNAEMERYADREQRRSHQRERACGRRASDLGRDRGRCVD